MIVENEALRLTKEYKQTKLGLIPSDWEVKTLGEIFEFKNGLNKEKEFFGYGTPIINYMDVFRNSGLYKSDIEGKVFLTPKEIKNYEVRMGDVFFTRTSETVDEIGISTVVLEELDNTVFSGFVLRGRPKNSILELTFKKYCFASVQVRKEITTTASYTTRALTNGKLLSNVKIPVPTKSEQTAIATALSDADALIRSLGKLIAKKRNIKQGAMQQLLQPKEGWEVKKLGDYLDYIQPIEYLVTDTEYNDNNQTPVLTAGKTFILGYTNEEHGIFNNLPVIIFDDFTTAIKYVDFPFKAKSSAMKMLVPKHKDVNLRFIYELMLRIKYPLGDHKRHWIGEYRHLEVILPASPEEQNKIATILSDMDAEISALETKLEKYRKVKLGMMQNLLTGKIRLV